MVEGRAVAGVMSQPFTAETSLRKPDKTVLRHAGQETVLRTSGITDIAGAKLTTTSPDLFLGDGADLSRRVGSPG